MIIFFLDWYMAFEATLPEAAAVITMMGTVALFAVNPFLDFTVQNFL